MVGGIVIETIVLDKKVWINCRGTGIEEDETCAIYVEKDKHSVLVEPGDKIWWQDYAYWSSPSLGNSDTKLKRVGFSGVRRPEKTYIPDNRR